MQYLDYNECKQRGTFDFPIEFYHINETHPQYTMPYHWHVEYEIIRILEGGFEVSLDAEEFSAKKDDIVFISGGTLHAGIPKDCIYECIVFDLNMLLNKDDITRKFIEPILNRTLLIKNHMKESAPKLHNVIWQLFDAFYEKPLGYQLIVKGALFEMFGIIYEQDFFTPASLKAPSNHKRIMQLKQVLEYIENQYSSPITLQQLSKIAGMSPKYFCQFFQEMTHKSPIDYLNYYRIERACHQLINTDTSITELSLNCGFNDLSYFIKTFKKYKGITPNKYRKQ